MKSSTRRPRLHEATSSDQAAAWKGCRDCDSHPGLCARCTRPIPYALTVGCLPVMADQALAAPGGQS